MQVRLARIEALAVLRLRAYADVHVRIGLVVVQDDHVLMAGQLDLGPWEAIFYGEFDGRRDKRVLIKIIGE